MEKHILKFKIATKIMIWFLIVTLVPLAVVGYLSYDSAKKQLEKEIMSKLVNTANDKADLMENYIINKKNDVSVLTHNPIIINSLQTMTPDSTGSNELKSFFTYYEDLKGYSNAYFISPKGEIVFSLKKGKEFHSSCVTGQNKGCVLGKAFELSQTSLDAQISDFEYNKGAQQASIFVLAPVIKNGKSIGAVALEINNKEIYSMTKDYSRLGKTGEIIIGVRIGDKVIFVSPTRHDPEASFKRVVDINKDAQLPLVRAVEGRNGFGIYSDYRGIMSLAAYKYMPSLSCGLVAKMDEAEAFTPVYNLRNGIIIIMIFAFLWAVAAAYFVSRSISAPINRLHEDAEIIGDGNLDYETKVESGDEIGQLAGAFNEMTHNLKNVTSSRDELDIEISERIKAEENLKKETAFIEKTIDTLPDIFYSFDLNGKYLKWNKEFNSVSGYTDEEIAVMKPADFFRGKDIARVTEAINAALKKGRVEVEATVVTKSGESILYEFSASRLEDHNGNIIGIVGLGKNIIERKKYQSQLEDRLHELEVFEKATINREGRIIELKEQIKELQSKLEEKK